MSKCLLWATLAVGCLAVVAGSAFGATWTQEGSSSLTASGYDDVQRMVFNDMAIDSNGVIYMTVGDRTSGPAGGLSIFTPNGSGYTINDISSVPNGMITKLIVVDDKVYGLQNWYEIGWWQAQATTVDYRIVRINPNGTLDEIVNMGSNFADRIVDMAPGPDGKIYFHLNGYDHGWDYLRRVDPTGAGPYTVETSPSSTIFDSGGDLRQTFFTMFYAGPADDGTPLWQILEKNRAGEYWRMKLSGMGWDQIENPYQPGTTTYAYRRGTVAAYDSTPGFGRRHSTALDYNNLSKQVYSGCTGDVNGASVYQWAWKRSGTYNYSVVTGDGNDGFVLETNKETGNDQWWRWSRQFSGESNPNNITFETRFKIVSESTSPAYKANLMAVSPIGHASACVTVYYDGTDLILRQVYDYDSPNWKTDTVDLANLGPISTGTWYTVRVYVQGSTKTVKCWFNGSTTPAYDGTVTEQFDYSEGGVYFGASVDHEDILLWDDADYNAEDAATAVVRFDYAKVAHELLDPATPTGEDWPDGPTTAPDFGLAGSHLTGNVIPESWLSTNVLTRWDGTLGADGLFTGLTSFNANVGGVTDLLNIHTNKNDPQITNKANGGEYWISALAINPKDGTAWMSYGAAADYAPGLATGYTDAGTVYTMGSADTELTGNEGSPDGTDTYVGDIMFAGDKVYAQVIDLVTGAVTLWSTDNPSLDGACCLAGEVDDCLETSELACLDAGGVWQGSGSTCATSNCQFQVCHDPFADADGDGDVDQDDFAVFQACYTGSSFAGALPGYPPFNCECFDVTDDGTSNAPDGVIDGNDFAAFQGCASGPGIPANAACDD